MPAVRLATKRAPALMASTESKSCSNSVEVGDVAITVEIPGRLQLELEYPLLDTRRPAATLKA